MRLVSFTKLDQPGFGRLQGEVIDVLGHGYGLRGILGRSEAELAALAMLEQLKLAEVELMPPVPDAGKIFCVATNFHEPAREGQPLPTHPLIFTRYSDTLVGDGAQLVCPPETSAFDFEGELAVIIGKPGHRISRSAAMAHVAGYACFNDGSVRDWQKHSTQFTPGKNFWRSGSFGPCLVTPAEIPDPSRLRLEARVNGVVKQQIGLDKMMFDVPWLISYISTFAPLSAGDVIATGTPSGFGSSRRPQEFLSIGDLVEVDIDGIGRLANRVGQG